MRERARRGGVPAVLAAGMAAVALLAACVASRPERLASGPADGGPGEDASDAADAGPGDGASDAADGADGGAACPAGRGPAMVRVGPDGGPRFCIDATEVTNAQYAQYLLTDPQPADQDAICKTFNASFRPRITTDLDDAAKAAHPVVYVDWCDATMFCGWAGKRLCRADEIQVACTRNRVQIFPYESGWNAEACNAKGGAEGGVLEPVAHRPSCEGAYAGVFDLVGNVGEWQDTCQTDAGENDVCPLNASSFASPVVSTVDNQTCAHADERSRSESREDLGIRCCAD